MLFLHKHFDTLCIHSEFVTQHCFLKSSRPVYKYKNCRRIIGTYGITCALDFMFKAFESLVFSERNRLHDLDIIGRFLVLQALIFELFG